ncbi:MAG: aspartate aminotransferase family protein [Christensenellaceae bacterium]
MTFEQIKALENASHMPTYGRYPVALESGHGTIIKDVAGKEYLDFGSGIGVSALGQTDDDWVAAVQAQTAKLAHISNLYYNETQALFTSELCAATGLAAAFLSNSGAEANECAIKLARKYSYDTYGENRSTIISLKQSFHGRTMATLSATGQDALHTHFMPFIPGFSFVEADDTAALKAAVSEDVCAILVESVQGEGGVIPLDEAYLGAIRAICDEKDILLIVDEIQTGVGRTGSFLACTGMGVTPDIVTMAKGLGGGLPIGACLCNEKLAHVMSAGMHGSTFGGNPIICAGARVVLEKVNTPAFLEEVTKKGAYLQQKLEELQGISEVRGKGLMVGLVLSEKEAPAVVNACLEKGLLVLTAKTLLRLLPPLTVSYAEIDAAVAILAEVLAA